MLYAWPESAMPNHSGKDLINVNYALTKGGGLADFGVSTKAGSGTERSVEIRLVAKEVNKMLVFYRTN
jgi:hypothetical protein